MTHSSPSADQRTSLTFQVGDAEDGKNPQRVKCWECGHVWIGLYLPQPISVAAKIMKALTCPKCGTGSKKIGMAPNE